MRPSASTFSTTPRMIWSTKYLIANTASTAPTRPPASEPVTSPSQTPATLDTTAAAKAPTSSWPSIAMLMTPERSHMQPARAPRISGIEPVRVFCSRLTVLIGMVLPASAQHSSDITKNSRTTATLRRRSPPARVGGGAPHPDGDRGGAEHVADRRGRRVDAGHLDRGRGQRQREGGVAGVREQPEQDVDQPEQHERSGRNEPAVHGGQRRARRGGQGRHPFHPFATASRPPARV